MRRLLSGLMLLLLLPCVHANAAALPREVSRWTEVAMPAKAKKADHDVWQAAANWADVEWRAFADQGQAVAERKQGHGAVLNGRPGFMRGLARFGRVDAVHLVRDGWLIGFNRGEFGAGLYWFSTDGARNEKISDQHVGGFFEIAKVVHAIEGSTAPGARGGSVLRIARDGGGVWRTEAIARLPSTPETVAAKADGSALITLSDALVSIDPNGRLRTLVADAPWRTLFPNSSTLSADQRHLYIGMRQYVADIDLATRRLRFLVPDRSVLHKLSAADERQIRGYLVVKVVRAGNPTLRIPVAKSAVKPQPIPELPATAGAVTGTH